MLFALSEAWCRGREPRVEYEADDKFFTFQDQGPSIGEAEEYLQDRGRGRQGHQVGRVSLPHGPFEQQTDRNISHLQIRALEGRIESGTMKLVEERKALAEIQGLRRSRKTVESFAAQQTSIDADKDAIAQAKAALDQPEVQALNSKWDAIKNEMDKLDKERDEAKKGADSLYDERNKISKEMDEVWAQRRALMTAYKEANDKYCKCIPAPVWFRFLRGGGLPI